MSLLKRLRDPIVWSIIGVAFGVIGLYFALNEPETDLSIEVIGAVSVLDINKSVTDLNILFQGQDIEKSNLSLKILSIRFMNAGETDILQSFYDRQDTLGLRVTSARLIEARLTSTNSDYLLSSVKPTIVDEHLLQIGKVILERGKYFVLELLVLQDKDQLPELLHVGKIAGIDEIRVVNTWDSEDSESFLSELLRGGILVQIVRPVVYLAGFLVVIVLSVGISASWSERKRKRRTERRRQLIGNLLPKPGESPQSRGIVDFVRKTFEDDGLRGLRRAQTLLVDEEKLREIVQLHQLQKQIDNLSDSMHQLRYQQSNIESRVPISQGEVIPLRPPYYRPTTLGLSELIDAGIVSVDEDGVETDLDLLNLLDSAIRHFEENGPKSI